MGFVLVFLGAQIAARAGCDVDADPLVGGGAGERQLHGEQALAKPAVAAEQYDIAHRQQRGRIEELTHRQRKTGQHGRADGRQRLGWSAGRCRPVGSRGGWRRFCSSRIFARSLQRRSAVARRSSPASHGTQSVLGAIPYWWLRASCAGASETPAHRRAAKCGAAAVEVEKVACHRAADDAAARRRRGRCACPLGRQAEGRASRLPGRLDGDGPNRRHRRHPHLRAHRPRCRRPTGRAARRPKAIPDVPRADAVVAAPGHRAR